MSNTLAGKVAVITGGARGIGRATAACFAEAGAVVYIWDVLPGGTQTALELGPDVHFQKVDVTKPAHIRQAVEAIMAERQRIDILINNAGILRDASFLKMSHEQWQQVIDVNLTGVFNCTKAIAPLMREQGYGRIVSASSIVGQHGNFGQTNYVAAKAAIIGMTKTWARELGKYGITVNAIAPGYVETEMTASMPEEIQEAMIRQIPVRRAGKPADIAAGYLFLASEAAGFVNGHTLSINGGAG